jgi:DNA polymerase III subunit gamma/tau
MSYEVLARKWRPQQFEDVVGQEHVTRTLRNAIESDRLAHAYIFVGPRGTGKTSLARIFAKALNCKNGPTVNPCDQCDACKEIAAGTSFDVLEIDGASNNGVEQVRDLRETVKYAPTRGKYKIYIIDEVHMLSVAAFNALLKTLEEPPPHVKFLFATTEPQKVLATILSRCQRFDLRRIATPMIVERLRLIAKAENVDVAEDALLAIARGAEGGLRDAESALDQLIAFRGKKIAEEDVLSVFGLVSRRGLEEMGEHVLKGDVRALVEGVGRMDESGKDLHRLVAELSDHFRNLLICLTVKDPAAVADLVETQVEPLQAQAALTDVERLLRIMGILNEAMRDVRFALSRRTLLEISLIRCARAASTVSLDEILVQINALRGTAAAPTASPPSVARVPAPAVEPQPAVKPHIPASAPDAVAPDGSELLRLKAAWPEIVVKVGKLAMPIKPAIADSQPLRVDGDRVVMGIDAEFAEHAQDLQVPRNRKAVEHVLSEVLSRQVTLEVQVTDLMSRAQEPQTAAPASPQPDPAAERPAVRQEGRTGRSRQEWLKDPSVQKAMKAFGGTVTEIRD